ncbi:hypothetical protein B0H11DRAFT_1790047 [Mycena galericulata]|nr:hypothetical protein B0H11DRAFT_1805733 [Mycena galericulata]KAJ7510979.1 hypothetical protein B0H11DRAFT_1790047 [Mycena galericulata]
MRPGSSPGVQDSEKNIPGSHDLPLLHRFLARFFPKNNRADVGENPQPTQKTAEEILGWGDPPYSKAESQQASAKLWAVYIDEAERYDRALVESWKADMEGMLIFSGLFSASVTAFLIESYPTLQSDSGDTTVQLLTQISRQLAGNNSVVFSDAVVFQPTQSSLVCNAFWFLSLSLALTCALLATLVEQWAREFLHKTDRRPSPIQRARVLTFLYFGVRRFGMHAVVDLIPMLLHISLVFFLAGLIAFLIPINHVIMSLICMVLAVFLAVYVMLTLMPLLALDSPYRTPFSYFLWNLIQRIHSRLSSESADPSSPASINDSIVKVALQTATSRDSRALKWTLESLTDDEQLLPFLEAIPDTLYGVKGFHGVNNYLFIPLLDTPSNPICLSHRIANFLLNCRSMTAEDPLCQRRLTAGMKAVWALGMGCGRTDHVFGTDWFGDRVMKALHRPHNWQGSWPHSYFQAARLAVDYTSMNNMRCYTKRLIHLAQTEDHTQLLRGVRDVLDNRQEMDLLSYAFSAQMRSLAGWVNGESHSILDALQILNSLQSDTIWLEASVSLVAWSLIDAARTLDSVGVLPHKMMENCRIIIPTVVDIPNAERMERFGKLPKSLFDPSAKAQGPDIMDLDRIMRCLLRLHPLLQQEEVIPIFALYLGRRNNLAVLQFAMADIDLLTFLDVLIEMIQSPRPTPDLDVLRTIQVILLLPGVTVESRWSTQDDRLWDYMVANDMFNSSSFMILSVVLTQRKLHHMHESASNLLQVVEGGRKEDSLQIAGTAVEDIRALAADLVLPLPITDDLLSQNFRPEHLVDEIQTRVKAAMIIGLTNLLSAYARPERPSNVIDAMGIVVRSFPPNFGSVDIGIMTRFAQSLTTIVQHLFAYPSDADLNQALAFLFSYCEPAKTFYHPLTAPIFEQALTLYLKFIEETAKTSFEDDDGDANHLKKVLDNLTKKMASDLGDSDTDDVDT